jgi:hypothetical protein
LSQKVETCASEIGVRLLWLVPEHCHCPEPERIGHLTMELLFLLKPVHFVFLELNP